MASADATTTVSAVDSVGVEAKAKSFENILTQKFTNNGQFVIQQLASATPLTMWVYRKYKIGL